MWCPEGYLTFQEIQKEFRQLFKRETLYRRTREIALCDDPEQSIGQMFVFTKLRTVDAPSVTTNPWPARFQKAQTALKRQCMVEFYTDCPSLSLVSSGGVCLRVSSDIAVFREVPNQGWTQPFIDPRTGLVSMAHFDKCFRASAIAIEQLRKDLERIDKNESEYFQFVALARIEDDAEMRGVFETFEGWAITCLQEHGPNNPEIYVSLDLEFEEVIEGDDESGEGTLSADMRRKTLKEQIIEIFDSKARLTKKEIQSKYFEGESREAFRAAWKEASLERPQLSKRGPKPR